MSGGFFDYKDQYVLNECADLIGSIIENNGTKVEYSQLDSWDKETWSENHDDKDCTKSYYDADPNYLYERPNDIIEEYKVAHVLLQLAAIYTHRIDYLEECDDDEDSFRNRLREDLSKIDSYIDAGSANKAIQYIKESIKR